LDPQEPRSKAPSLLTGDAPPAQTSKSPERILSGLQGSSASVSKPARSRRWIWPVALAGVAVAAIILLDVGGVFEPSKPVPSSLLTSAPSEPAATEPDRPASTAPANAAPATASSATAAVGGKPSTGSQNAAVILADQFGPASSSSTASATPAAAASTASKDTAALGDMFAPHAADKKPLIPIAHTAKRGDAANGDSDVDLLAVLIKHLEVNDTPGKKHARHGKKATADEEVLPQDCPPANTEAGVTCRQRFCAAHTGQGDASCPAASPGGA
jgi:hypothetical protein